ncbi:MAG: alpha/beta hydrolase [Candidatus Delongbacteria bacterium]|nr:alpha/beta hydrolase [Candidatus Delongbacteria bacterium]
MFRTIIRYFLAVIGLMSGIQAQYSTINNQGLDVYYRIFGTGQPILIIGGGPGDDSERYLSLCELLSPVCQCILIDQRGTGKTLPATSDSTTISLKLTLSDFEALRSSLGFKQWGVLGFSYGGFLASLYADTEPNSISFLILMSSMGLNTDSEKYFGNNIESRLTAYDWELIRFWSDSTRRSQNPHHAQVECIRAMMPGYFYDRNKSLLVSQTIKDSDFNLTMGDWIWKDIAKQKADLTLHPARYHGPVFILHGRQDPLGESIPISLADYYSSSHMTIIEKCGHYAWIEQPEKILSVVREGLMNLHQSNH